MTTPGVDADAILVNRRRRVQNGTGVAAHCGVTSFYFSMYNVCLQTGRGCYRKSTEYVVQTVSRACELYQYVTPLQGTNEMIAPFKIHKKIHRRGGVWWRVHPWTTQSGGCSTFDPPTFDPLRREAHPDPNPNQKFVFY